METPPPGPLPDSLRGSTLSSARRGGEDDPGLRPLPTYLMYRQSLSQRLSGIHNNNPMRQPSQSSSAGSSSLLPIERDDASANAAPFLDDKDDDSSSDDGDYDLENRLSSYLTKNVAGAAGATQANHTSPPQNNSKKTAPPQQEQQQRPENKDAVTKTTTTVAVSFGGTTLVARAAGENDDEVSSLGDLGPSSRALQTLGALGNDHNNDNDNDESDEEDPLEPRTPPFAAGAALHTARRANPSQQQQQTKQSSPVKLATSLGVDTSQIDQQQQQPFPEQAQQPQHVRSETKKVPLRQPREGFVDDDHDLLKESAGNDTTSAKRLSAGTTTTSRFDLKQQLRDWSYHCYEGRWFWWLLLFLALVGLPLGIGFGISRQGGD